MKVSMDGAPYLRKIDLRVYNSYSELLKALENMFKLTIGAYSERVGYHGSDYTPTYEDKDGDWMLVGDVPWEYVLSTPSSPLVHVFSFTSQFTPGLTNFSFPFSECSYLPARG
ncbi:hypothetical protein SLA2020_240230 [Shorea laevis]